MTVSMIDQVGARYAGLNERVCLPPVFEGADGERSGEHNGR